MSAVQRRIKNKSSREIRLGFVHERDESEEWGLEDKDRDRGGAERCMYNSIPTDFTSSLNG